MKQCSANDRIKGYLYQPTGYASIFEWEYIEAADKAQKLAYEAACVAEREEDLAANVHVESDNEEEEEEEEEEKTSDFRVHGGGNVILNWSDIHGLGKRE